MKAKSRSADFNRTAAGICAQAMEQALSAIWMPQQSMKQDDVKRAKLDGGCLLYSVPTRYWRKAGKAT